MAHAASTVDSTSSSGDSDGIGPQWERRLRRLVREDGAPYQTCDTVELAARYCAEGCNGEVIRLTAGIENTDDATAMLLVYRATALARVGLFEGAKATFGLALRLRGQRREVRHFALLRRADAYAEEGRRAQARRDLLRIVAEGAAVGGVHTRLAALRAR